MRGRSTLCAPKALWRGVGGKALYTEKIWQRGRNYRTQCCCLADQFPAGERPSFLELHLVIAVNPVLPPRTPYWGEGQSVNLRVDGTVLVTLRLQCGEMLGITDRQSPVKDWGSVPCAPRRCPVHVPHRNYFLVTVLLPFSLKASASASPFPHFDLAVPFASR